MIIQAIVVCVSYALAIVLVFMPSIPYDDRRFSFSRRLLYAIAMAVYALMLAYSISCAVTGGCVGMTWVSVLLYAVVPCIIILMYSLAFSSMEELRRRAQKMWDFDL